jgi:malate dehydrogenase (oxaloacetate-decarboxylating)(NADP+)
MNLHTSAASRPLPTGVELLRDPALNKGTAFTQSERDALGLRGLLPPRVTSEQLQAMRVLENLRASPDPLAQYVYLAELHDRNEGLFFRTIIDNLEETLPIIYTPTVGLACQRFGHIFQRPRGLFVSATDRGRIAQVLRNWPYRDVAMIVVSDGQRILGLGDLGAHGMGIPVGKLALYTACAGVHPERCLPVLLDAGTDNEALRTDPFYLGLPQPRLRGADYDAFVDEFVTAAQQVFPGVTIQFEDFGNHNAFRLLARYRDRVCSFNDDIQGTAAVVLAGLLAALRVTGGRLRDQRILFQGAGEAAIGIADLVVAALVEDGLDADEARRRCWLLDSRGLVVDGRADLAEHKLAYAHPFAAVADLLEAVQALRPTALIGVAAVPGAFTRPVLQAMARYNARPIVFALSNPTSKSECTADAAYRATGGRVLFASGSPFEPVTLDTRTFVPRQGNNAYVFPGVGLGAITTRATRITDTMFLEAAHALAAEVSPEDLAQGSLYPPLRRIREVSANIAVAVARIAFAEGYAGIPEPADLRTAIASGMYDPHYGTYSPAP